MNTIKIKGGEFTKMKKENGFNHIEGISYPKDMKEFNLSDEIWDTFLSEEFEGNCRVKDVKEAVKLTKDEIEDAQEDCGNLDWISKEQAIKIINKRFGEKLC